MQKNGVIEDFLKYYQRKSTKKIYKCVLNKYFKTIECKPDKYFDKPRDYNKDIKKFALTIKDMCPKTYSSYINVVKQLFMSKDITLEDSTKRAVLKLVTNTRALTQDRIPTQNEFKKILSYSDLKLKSLLLILASSGMRIGELTQIKIADVDFENEPTKISIKGEYTKTRDPRITFMNTEATFYAKEWLKQHDTYLKQACNRLNLPGKTKSLKDDRLYPMHPSAAHNAFRRLLKLSDLDEIDSRTKRRVIHLHVFRKRFYSKLRLAIPEGIVQTLVGHQGYLTNSYARYEEKELASYYKKGMHALNVLEAGDYSEQIKALKNEIKLKDEKLKELLIAQLEYKEEQKRVAHSGYQISEVAHSGYQMSEKEKKYRKLLKSFKEEK